MKHHGIVCVLVLAAAVAGQSNWTQVAATPQAFYGHAMVFDRQRQVVVLHSDQTYEWDGTRWTARNLALVPAPTRRQFAMAYDPLRFVTVLFGGAYHGDTWEYDGTNWRAVPTTGGPGTRCCAPMAYDYVRQRVVLFGGYDGSRMLDDTWEWDGTVWTQLSPPTRPSPRCCGDMVFDLARGVTVMFGGGLGFTSSDTDETWEWSGLTWQQLPLPVRPSARRGGQFLEYDPLRGRALLHGGGVGGTGQPRFNDLWEYDGLAWVARQPAALPSVPWLAAMAFDEARGQLVRNGGIGPAGPVSETWIFTTTTSADFVRYGAACAGTLGLPRLAADTGLPWLGGAFALAVAPVPASSSLAVLAVGRSQTMWNGVPLPLPLASAGMPGCSLLASPEFFVPMVIQAGRAAWSVTLPNDPALAGANVYTQAFVHDPGVNLLGLVASDGGRLTFGIL